MFSEEEKKLMEKDAAGVMSGSGGVPPYSVGSSALGAGAIVPECLRGLSGGDANKQAGGYLCLPASTIGVGNSSGKAYWTRTIPAQDVIGSDVASFGVEWRKSGSAWQLRIGAGNIGDVSVSEQAYVTVGYALRNQYVYVRVAGGAGSWGVAASVPPDDDESGTKYYRIMQIGWRGDSSTGRPDTKKLFRVGDITATSSGTTSGANGEVTVLVDMQFNTSSGKLQKKTQVLTFEDGLLTTIGEVSAWTDMVGGQAASCD